jgi:hypothetical protein
MSQNGYNRTQAARKRIHPLNHNYYLTLRGSSVTLYPTIPSTPLNDAHQEGYSFVDSGGEIVLKAGSA